MNPEAPETLALEILTRVSTWNEAMDKMCELPVARGRTFLDFLKATPRPSDHHAANRVDAIHRFTLNVHSIIQQLAHIQNLDELAKLGEQQPLLALANLRELASFFAADAEHATDLDLATRIRRGLAVLEDAWHRTETLGEDNGSIEWVESHAALAEDGFLDWLNLLFRRSTLNQGRKQLIGQMGHIASLERRIRAAKMLAQTKHLRGRRTGHALVSRPPTTEEAEGWFFLPFIALPQLRHIHKDLTEGALDIEDALRAMTNPDSTQGLMPDNAAGRTMLLRTSLLAAATFSGPPELSRECLFLFRRQLDQEPVKALVPGERATYYLRYILTLVANIAIVDSPRATLEDAIDVLERIGYEVTAESNPGIIRDSHFARARILRILSQWRPESVREAVNEFRAGLDVRGCRFEREPRGRALMDLLGALSALPSTLRPSESELMPRYEEAIIWSLGFPSSRATALRNFAVFLNERTTGDATENQERALQLLEEALIELDLDDPDGDQANPHKESADIAHVRELRAAIHQTKGNVLRARSFGDWPTRWRAAVDSYYRALETVAGPGFEELKAEIHFCLAVTYLDSETAGGVLPQVEYHLSEARRLAPESPRVIALVATALGRISLHTEGAQGGASLNDSLQRTEAARAHFSEIGDLVRQGDAAHLLGRMHLIADNSTQALERAEALFAEATTCYQDGGASLHAIRSHISLADVRNRLWRSRTAARDVLLRSAASLAEAIRHAEAVWGATTLQLERVEASQVVGSLRTERLWTLAIAGVPHEQVLAASDAALSLELERDLVDVTLVRHARASGDDALENYTVARRLLAIEESERTNSIFQSDPLATNAGDIQSIRTARREANEQRVRLTLRNTGIAQAIPPLVKRQDRLRQGDLLIEAYVAEHGTVAICHGEELPQDGRVALLPLAGKRLASEVSGLPHERSWQRAYAERRSRPNEWLRATDTLLRLLSTSFWDPLVEFIPGGLHNKSLILMPSALGTLPLHAGTVGGIPVIDEIESLSLCSNVRTTHLRRADDTTERRALCILSDPELPGTARIDSGATEIATAARILTTAGVQVTVIASSDKTSGPELFARKGVLLPPSVRVESIRPTVGWVSEHLCEFDFVLYSGHGKSGDGNPGDASLILVDADGSPRPMRLLELLETSPMRDGAVVVLSACETSHGHDLLTGDHSSIASAFLRLGASDVIGTLWDVGDAIASAFSESFIAKMAEGLNPGQAYVRALRAVRPLTNGRPARWGAFCHWTN